MSIKIKRFAKSNVLDGTAQGQMAFWDATLGKWTYTENTELFWDDTNKDLLINTLKLGAGSITDSSGDISFGDEDLITTGSIQGTLITDGTATIIGGSISAGAITGTQFNVNDGNTYISEDGSGNMSFTDAVSGTVLLSSLASFWSRDAVNGYVYPKTLTDYVGIGTDSPASLLHLESDDSVSMTLERTSANATFIELKDINNSLFVGGSGSMFVVNDTADASTPYFSADSYGRINAEGGLSHFRAIDGSNYSEIIPAGINLKRATSYIKNIYTNGNTNYEVIGTGKHSFKNAGVDTLTILSSGNVGIGTSSPDSQVHIQGLSGADGVLHLSNSTFTDGGFYITGTSDNIGVFSGGSYYDRGAASWRAVSTEAAGFEMKDGGIKFRMNTGLTVGNTHELTDRVRLVLNGTNTRMGIGLGQNIDPSYTFHAKAQSGNGFITFFTEDTTAIAGIALGDKDKQYQGQVQYDNSTDKMNLKAYNNTIITLDGINERVGIGTTSPNSTVHNAGSQANAYIAKTANYTLTASDYTVNCTANSFTITLPTAVGITGRIYNIKNTGTGTITVDGDGTETIDGELTQTVTQWDNLSIQSDGANYIIL